MAAPPWKQDVPSCTGPDARPTESANSASMSNGGRELGVFGAVGVSTEPAVDDLGELSFQAAHGLPGTLALVDLAAIVVVPGAWVHALHVGHQVQCGVERWPYSS